MVKGPSTLVANIHPKSSSPASFRFVVFGTMNIETPVFTLYAIPDDIPNSPRNINYHVKVKQTNIKAKNVNSLWR